MTHGVVDFCPPHLPLLQTIRLRLITCRRYRRIGYLCVHPHAPRPDVWAFASSVVERLGIGSAGRLALDSFAAASAVVAESVVVALLARASNSFRLTSRSTAHQIVLVCECVFPLLPRFVTPILLSIMKCSSGKLEPKIKVDYCLAAYAIKWVTTKRK